MANCLHPVTIPNKGKGPAYIEVPCGKCPKCLATKLNKWVFRLKQHYKSYQFASFITLTYNDDNLPYCWLDNDWNLHICRIGNMPFHAEHISQCLWKKDLQSFFRELRKFYGNRKNLFSYYAIGEYGMNPKDGMTDRPHYHIMLFSNDIDVSTFGFTQLLLQLWNKGFVDNKPVTEFRIQYVCKHHLKPKNSKYFPVKQFTLRSNGLGLAFLDKETAKWLNDNKPNVIYQRDGIKIGIPRYYRTKLLQLFGYDISSAYIQRKSFNKLLVETVDRGDISTDMYDRIVKNREVYEQHLENQNLYKSKNKRK